MPLERLFTRPVWYTSTPARTWDSFSFSAPVISPSRASPCSRLFFTRRSIPDRLPSTTVSPICRRTPPISEGSARASALTSATPNLLLTSAVTRSTYSGSGCFSALIWIWTASPRSALARSQGLGFSSCSRYSTKRSFSCALSFARFSPPRSLPAAAVTLSAAMSVSSLLASYISCRFSRLVSRRTSSAAA